MNQPNTPQASKISLRYIQQGFTLIELLVAMSITLLITAGIAALFANTIFNTKTLNSATAINEESIRINSLLGRNIRMSGYVDWLSNASLFNAITINEATNSNSYNLKSANQFSMFQRAFATAQTPAEFAKIPLPLFGCDAGYINPSDPLSFTTTNTCQSSSSNSETAAITVSYQVKSQPQANYSALLPTTNGGAMNGDCAGRNVVTPYTANRFYLNDSKTAKTGEPTIYDLMCLSRANTQPEPLASNIEQWVITYGVPGVSNGASPSNDTQITRYLTAQQVTTQNAWNQVMAVRSCFLIVGERGSATISGNSSGSVSNRLDCLGNPIRIGAELRLRQSFTQTIILRNQIHTPNIN